MRAWLIVRRGTVVTADDVDAETLERGLRVGAAAVVVFDEEIELTPARVSVVAEKDLVSGLTVPRRVAASGAVRLVEAAIVPVPDRKPVALGRGRFGTPDSETMAGPLGESCLGCSGTFKIRDVAVLRIEIRSRQGGWIDERYCHVACWPPTHVAAEGPPPEPVALHDTGKAPASNVEAEELVCRVGCGRSDFVNRSSRGQHERHCTGKRRP